MIGMYIDVLSLYTAVNTELKGKIDFLKLLARHEIRYAAIAYGCYKEGRANKFEKYLRDSGFEVNFRNAERDTNGQYLLTSNVNYMIVDSLSNMFSKKVTESVFACCDDGLVPCVQKMLVRDHKVTWYVTPEFAAKLPTILMNANSQHLNIVILNKDFLLENYRSAEHAS